MAVRDTDRGYKALTKRIEGLGSAKIKVGILEGAGAETQHGDLTVVTIATINEFGLGVPERSFLRAWFDENQERAQEAMSRLLASVVEGKRTKEQALELFGLWLQAEIQQKIAAGVPPENAPSTIEKKGSSTPLIDTGVMRSAVSFVVLP